MTEYTFDWSELAFESKKPLSSLKATFIAAPREISVARFTQLLKEHLPKGHIVLGISKEEFVDGFEGQPQFKMLQQHAVQAVIDKVNIASHHKVYTLAYLQRELPHILEKVNFSKVVFVNGSWLHSFHTSPTYYGLINKKIPYELVSPFVDEVEAKAYEVRVNKEIAHPVLTGLFDGKAILKLSDEVAKQSFDYTFQTGTVLAKKTKNAYTPLLSAFNKVLPYQTYAMHYGASREKNFSPPNDLNYYDTIHAEMSLIVEAQKQGISLKGTTLFVNLMPCPACARTIAETDIAEIIYRIDHSEGYAVNLLQKVGKTIQRIVY